MSPAWGEVAQGRNRIQTEETLMMKKKKKAKKKKH